MVVSVALGAEVVEVSLALITDGLVIAVLELGVALLEVAARDTEITDISPLPCRTDGQVVLTGLTVTDILGFKGLLVTTLLAFEDGTDVMEMPCACDLAAKALSVGLC